ncbi:MAG: transcriptional regulator NrdR [Nitrospirota bacterium]|nr:transcriptional regulator NrdR [Nitrospirota bacterium]
MKCPFCSYPEDRVVDSRSSQDGSAIRRRRECLKCARRFTTYERLEVVAQLVVKKDGSREPFDRGKVLSGMARACRKRPVSSQQMEAEVERIEQSLQESGEAEVASARIGEKVMEALSRLDPVAYVRFASVYREFKDVNAFMDEIKSLLRLAPPAPADNGEAPPEAARTDAAEGA